MTKAELPISNPKAAERGILGIVFLTIFLDLIGFGILIPIQPFYAESFGATPATVTLLGASFSLVQFLFAPLLGRLSDTYGRRPIMLLTIGVNVIGYFVFGLAQSLFILFVARIISGFGSANLGTAQAIIADSTSQEKRAKGMGVIGAAFGLGFIFGPAIGGLFGQFGLATPAFVAASLSAANWIFTFIKLPETRLPRAKESHDLAEHQSRWSIPLGLSRQALIQAVRYINVRQLFWIILVGTVAFSQMEQVLGLFVERTLVPESLGQSNPVDHLKYSARLTSYFLVLVGITLASVQGLLIGRLVKVFGERRLVLMGTLLIAVSLALIPPIGNLRVLGLFLALGMLLAIGSGIYRPSLQSLLSQSVEQDSYGRILGLGQSISALGRVLGPSIAGILFQLHKGVPFWVGSVLMLSCTLVALTLRTKSPIDRR